MTKLRRWLPSLLVMGVIFWSSSQPASDLPDFDWTDRIIKKGGHMLGYGLLSWSYWYALGMKTNKRWLAWFIAILYAVTDEYHQSFVVGRSPSALDVLVFDNLGALISTWLIHSYEEKRSAQMRTDHIEA